MSRSLAAALAAVLATPMMLLPVSSRGSDRTLPMHFELRREGPVQACGVKCRLWISATGAITADTPRDFQLFAQDHDLTGATVVLDSDGGSVHGAIALGREIRRLGLDTAVGHVVDLNDPDPAPARAKLSPRADCESMCAFVVIAGVHRYVPPEARVMVHQIWLGDRREDPTAASYSAEDLVLVQRDIGKLAQYAAEMGASIELLDLALRIPPWEPMHTMTRAEISRTRMATEDTIVQPVPATVAVSPPANVEPLPRITDGVRVTPISEQRWAVVDRKGAMALARHHSLTIAGEDIGSFDLIVACGAGPESYDVSYVEHRHTGRHAALPRQLGTVTVAAGNSAAGLKVVSSERHRQPDELVSYASASVPAALIRTFAAAGYHSMMITTKSERVITAIRLGNTGARQNLPQLDASCPKAIGDRAAIPAHRAGGLASAK